MPSLLYLHGFLSSPNSYKAVATQKWLAEHHPHWAFLCPQLPMVPAQTQAFLEALVQASDEPLYLIGSSLGGFWATYLVECYPAHCPRAVLVNPSVKPYESALPLVGQTLKNYHTDDTYELTAACIDVLKAATQTQLQEASRYWLLAQTGDETLDYRDAKAKYAQSKQTIEAGGNHSFEHFERHLPAVMAFFQGGGDA